MGRPAIAAQPDAGRGRDAHAGRGRGGRIAADSPRADLGTRSFQRADLHRVGCREHGFARAYRPGRRLRIACRRRTRCCRSAPAAPRSSDRRCPVYWSQPRVPAGHLRWTHRPSRAAPRSCLPCPRSAGQRRTGRGSSPNSPLDGGKRAPAPGPGPPSQAMPSRTWPSPSSWSSARCRRSEHLGGATAWGLVSSGFAGALLGGLVAFWIKARRPIAFGMATSMLMALPMLALAARFPLYLIVAAAVIAMTGGIVLNTNWDTAVQQLIPNEMLSRFRSYDYLLAFIAMPVGYAIAGPLSLPSERTRSCTPPGHWPSQLTRIPAILPTVRAVVRHPDGTITGPSKPCRGPRTGLTRHRLHRMPNFLARGSSPAANSRSMVSSKRFHQSAPRPRRRLRTAAPPGGIPTAMQSKSQIAGRAIASPRGS